MVGAKAELADAVGESASAVLALVLETERDADRNAANTIATEVTTVTATTATRRQKVENQ